MRRIKIALAGNPNSGKTSIFNNLTGSHQRTGNWPGVTVEKREGYFTYRGIKIEVVDLPGIYSLSAASIDEKIARDYLFQEKPDAVVCIVDSSNLERNLYLVMELIEMGMNVVIDLNMADLAEAEGLEIDEEKLSLLFKRPIVKTVANKGAGIDTMKDAIIFAYESMKITCECDTTCPFYSMCPFKKSCPYPSSTTIVSESPFINYHVSAENAVSEVSTLLSNYHVNGNLRWLSLKLLEGDQHIMHMVREKYGIKNIENFIQTLAAKVEKEIDNDIITSLIETRYGFIKGIVSECVTRKRRRKASRELSDKIDRVVMSRVLGIPIFLAMMYLTFKIVFALGGPLSDLISAGFDYLSSWISNLLTGIGASNALISFITNGVISGAGAVIVFLPNILLLFFVISILEDSGYMTRAAFVMDKFMHTLGLHGKSFIPMILGFGCNVPAIMATRTLKSRKDRILTILVIPLMSCSARLPIYVLFASIFFPGHEDIVVFSLYLLGIVLAIFVAKVMKGIFFKEEVAPLIMELPPYRLPQWKNSLQEMWLRSRLFLTKAGTIIFGTVVVIWILSSLPVGVEYASGESIIGQIGKFIAPIFKPAGFGFWQAAVALIFGILAKEVVVGTFGTLFGGAKILSNVLPHYFTPISAYSFMVMSLIYIPCIATVATIKSEVGWRWALVTVSYSLILGWFLSVLIYQIGILL